MGDSETTGEQQAERGAGMSQPTKENRKAASDIFQIVLETLPQELRTSFGDSVIDVFARIIAINEAPERERAHRIGTELALHQHEVKKLRERARILCVDVQNIDLDNPHTVVKAKAAARDLCDLAAAEALETK